MQINNIIATSHINDHSHEALRVVELAVGVDDLGPRREALPAPRAGDVLHVGHAKMGRTISLGKVEKAALKIPTQLTEMIRRSIFGNSPRKRRHLFLSEYPASLLTEEVAQSALQAGHNS